MMTVTDLITRVNAICNKYDVDKHKDTNVSGNDTFDRLYSAGEADAALQFLDSQTGFSIKVEVLLITSQKIQKFIFPKGGWELDESVEEVASRESLEEAGVLGQVQDLLLEDCDEAEIAELKLKFSGGILLEPATYNLLIFSTVLIEVNLP